MAYDFDLRDLWSGDGELAERVKQYLTDRMVMYDKLIKVLKKCVEAGKLCNIRYNGEVYKGDIPLGLIKVVRFDYLQARAFEIDPEYLSRGYEDLDSVNLGLIKVFVEIIWKLEKEAREYCDKVLKNGCEWVFINIDEQFMGHNFPDAAEMQEYKGKYSKSEIGLNVYLREVVKFYMGLEG